jgi:hypothetical protein
MPLFENAAALIKANLQQFNPHQKVKVKPVVIGVLTDAQLAVIHTNQREQDLPLSTKEVVFIGWHAYKSRILKDGYTVDDVVDQISSAMSAESIVIATEYLTAIENPNPREDRYGKRVNDRAILECTSKHPRPELFSVIPKGDGKGK